MARGRRADGDRAGTHRLRRAPDHRGLAFELSAKVTLDYAADGLVCPVVAPASALTKAE
jgi:hypothetical protein